MKLSRQLFAGLGIITFNVVTFATATPIFLNEIHHHWIVPAFSALLLFESSCLAATPRSAQGPRWSILALVGLSALLLFWRQFSMFACFRHCEGRLALGLAFLAGASVLVGLGASEPLRRTARLSVVFLSIWGFLVILIGWRLGTLTLR